MGNRAGSFMLDRLNIDAETPLHISVEGTQITPVSLERRAKFEAAMKGTMEKYADVFKRLAE